MRVAESILRLVAAIVAYSLVLMVIPFGDEISSSFSWWIIASNALTAGVLFVLCLRSRLSGFHLTFAVFIILFTVSHVLTLLEAAFFGLEVLGVPLGHVFFGGLVSSAVSSPLFVIIAGRMRSDEAASAATMRWSMLFGLVWRVCLCAVAYFLLYIIAGLLVLPYVKHYYANLPIPSMAQLIPLQLVRGSIYIAASFVLIKNMKGKSVESGVLIGLVFAILGGIAPLLIPNVFMPPEVRLAHGIEIAISNFLYGFLVGTIFFRYSRRLDSDSIGPIREIQITRECT